MTEPPSAPYDPNAEPGPYQPPSPYPPSPYPPPRYRPQYPPLPGQDALPPPSQYQSPQYQPPPSQYQPPPPQHPTPQYQPSPGWAAQGDWPAQSGWEQLGPPLPKPPGRRWRAPLIAAVAVVAVIGGGAATYVAVSDSHSGFQGAATPEEAVTSLVDDLNSSDVLGILDHLAPGERAALIDPVKESISQAKRLHILRGTADPGRLSGIDVTAKSIRYDTASDEAINDHVRIVKVVGGTITVNADLSKVPFTAEYLKIAFPGGLPSSSKSTNTIDVAALARDNGPVRIATQKVGGKWYPSLMYTVADYAVQDSGGQNPTAADYVAPKGAPSATDAVRQAITALGQNDYRRLIELTSPDELPVLHDYGGVILKNASAGDPPFSVKDLQLSARNVSGATRVSLRSITVAVPGHETTVAVNGDCLDITVDGNYRNVCADAIIDQLNAGPLRNRPVSATEAAALKRFASGIPRIGIDVTESHGQWYLNPVRSYLDLSNALLEPLQDNDFLTLLKLLQR